MQHFNSNIHYFIVWNYDSIRDVKESVKKTSFVDLYKKESRKFHLRNIEELDNQIKGTNTYLRDLGEEHVRVRGLNW